MLFHLSYEGGNRLIVRRPATDAAAEPNGAAEARRASALHGVRLAPPAADME
jgi:hypothetical protein